MTATRGQNNCSRIREGMKSTKDERQSDKKTITTTETTTTTTTTTTTKLKQQPLPIPTKPQLYRYTWLWSRLLLSLPCLSQFNRIVRQRGMSHKFVASLCCRLSKLWKTNAPDYSHKHPSICFENNRTGKHGNWKTKSSKSNKMGCCMVLDYWK